MSSDDSTRNAPPDPSRPREVRVSPVIDDEVAQGESSNLATIISGNQDFFIDFGRVVPGKTEFRVFSRIILTPAHAKSLASALTDHVKRHEQAHGPIALPEPPRGPTGGLH